MRKWFSDLFNSVLRILAKTHLLGPGPVAKLKYYQMLHRWPDLKHPKDLNEKINWLKFNGDTSMWPMLADKYAVRSYVRDKGFGDTLTKLLGKWERPEDIDWENLPESFVLKLNNGSGDVVVCKDKSKLDIPATVAHFSKVMKIRCGFETSELHYTKIKPLVIAEELLDSSTQPAGSSSLVDYKFWCFDGEPYSVWACYGRTPSEVYVNLYDLEWNVHPEVSVFTGHYKDGKGAIPRPESLPRMLEIASALSKGHPQMRVDLYEVDGKVYFGELTLTSAGGYMKYFTQDYLIEMGNKVKLPSGSI